MADASRQPTDIELHEALLDLGREITFPGTPDVAAAVRARVEARPRAAQPPGRLSLRLPALPRRRWRQVALVLLAALLVAVAILALSPGARASLGGWLRLRGVVIEFGTSRPAPTPPPLGTHLQLGRRLPLTEAQHRVGFQILTPHGAGLERPDEVYLADRPPGGQVALVYRPRLGLPRAAPTGVGLLLTEFRATLEPMFFKKLAMGGTQVQFVTVNGGVAYWISGETHLFGYTRADGQFATESLRLAGNTLLWQDGELTLRLEGAMSQQTALRIAASLR